VPIELCFPDGIEKSLEIFARLHAQGNQVITRYERCRIQHLSRRFPQNPLAELDVSKALSTRQCIGPVQCEQVIAPGMYEDGVELARAHCWSIHETVLVFD
jgi:hypothetical protein